MKAVTIIGIVEQDSIVKMEPALTSHVANRKLQNVNLRENAPIAVGAAPLAFHAQSVAYLATNRLLVGVLSRTCQMV